MATSVAYAAASNKHAHKSSRIADLLDQQAFEAICQEQDYHWREQKLGPGETMRHFAWQILMGNVSCDAVEHHSNGTFTSAAYCQARQRLPLSALSELSDRISRTVIAHACRGGSQAEHLWRGHRVWRIDGSGAQLADSPEVRAYFGCSGKQKPGCGYPTAHLLLLTGAAGVGMKMICSPLRCGDMTHATGMHECLQAGDVLLGDGQFGGWGHLQQLQRQQLHGVFPSHHSRTIGWGRNAEHGPNRRFIKTLGYRDQLVEYRKPQQRPAWMDKKTFEQAPQWLRVREVKRWVTVGGVGREIIVVTTLLDDKKYPAKKLVKLLATRWLIETQLRSLKTTMGMEQLKCKSVEGVLKELLMYLIVYNLLRLLMLQAAQRQGVPLERVSFADALARLRWGDINESWVDLEVVPLREGRVEPRVVKRRPKAFARMTQPRAKLRQQLLERRRMAA